nr:golgin subfamily A member 7B [Jaculus jaculus]
MRKDGPPSGASWKKGPREKAGDEIRAGLGRERRDRPRALAAGDRAVRSLGRGLASPARRPHQHRGQHSAPGPDPAAGPRAPRPASPASAPRTAPGPPLAAASPPALRVSTADSPPRPALRQPRCLVRSRNMATEVHNLQELRRSASLATKVFIQRDYSDGTICQFQTKFPPELDSRIERQLFEETVKTLNGFYAEAEKIGGSSYLEGCLACATAYFIFLCMETHYEKVLKKISRYIQEQNEKIFAPRGLLLTDPVERGMRVIEISIYEDRCSSGSSSSGSSSGSGSSSAGGGGAGAR